MKDKRKKLQYIPTSAEVSNTCIVYGDVILGDYTKIRKNSVVGTINNTIIIGSCVSINEDVKITSYGKNGYTFICNNVEIGNGAHIYNATLEENVQVGREAMVLEGCYIARGATIGNGTIITPHSRVLENTQCEANSVYSGNPAIKIGSIDLSTQNIKQKIKTENSSKAI